jgi:hypothetical protein
VSTEAPRDPTHRRAHVCSDPWRAQHDGRGVAARVRAAPEEQLDTDVLGSRPADDDAPRTGDVNDCNSLACR